MAQALAAAGCRDGLDGRRIGIAEGPRRDGEGHARRADPRRRRDACTAAGIEVGFFLQFGYPGEEWEDIEATLALVRELRPDDIGVSVSYPLPGTTFHARVRAGARRQAELGGLGRPRDDVSRNLRARVLPACIASCTPNSARPGTRIGSAPSPVVVVCHGCATSVPPRRGCITARRSRCRAPIGGPLAPAATEAGTAATGSPAHARAPQASAAVRGRRLVTRRPRVVLYNPRAVFYTMPLGARRARLGLGPVALRGRHYRRAPRG